MADEDLSIDDQADTATGGLANDTPSMPMSPPPRGAPSALGGLAGAAQSRGMFGRPARTPLGPGTSPWAAPGQSQLPQQPRQASQRWEGTTASLAFPRGSPQPRASFTPFLRGPPTTNIHQWGQIDPNDSLPQPFEAPSLYGNLAKFFSQNGSAAIAPLALSMNKNSAAFLNGVMQGQEWRAKMHRQQMLDDAAELEQKQQKEMYTYYDTASEYESAKGVGTAPEVGSYAIRGRTLLQAWEDEANKLGDDKFLAVLGTGSVEKALDFLHKRNDNWQTLAKTNKATEKQADEDNAKDWGVPPSFGGGQGAASDRNYIPPYQTAQAGGGGQVPQGAPAPTPSSVMQPLGPNGTLAPFQDAGLNNFRDGTSLNDVPKGKTRAAAAEYSRGLGSQFQDVLRQIRDGKIKPEDAPAALDKIVSGAGADYQSIYRGNNPPTGAAGRSPYWQTLRTLAAPDPIMQQATQRDFATSGRSGVRLRAGLRMSDAAITVLKEMKNFSEGELPPQNVIDQWISTGITGDPKWSNLFAAVNTYMQEHQSLQSPTGRFFESEMQEQRKNIRITQGLKAIRGLMKVDAENASKLVGQLVDDYHRGTRDYNGVPPNFDPAKADVLNAIANLDPANGFAGIPENTLPDPLRGLGLGKTDGGGQAPASTLPPGWTVTPVQ